MKGISAIIVAILLLMISISLAGFGYVFFTTMFTSITTESEEVMGTTVERMLAQMKIESIETANNKIHIRNTGKVDLTDFEVYLNNALVSSTPPTGDEIKIGEVGTITNVNGATGIAQDDTVKVTCAQGTIAVQTAPPP
jgi:hypothetical protein